MLTVYSNGSELAIIVGNTTTKRLSIGLSFDVLTNPKKTSIEKERETGLC